MNNPRAASPQANPIIPSRRKPLLRMVIVVLIVTGVLTLLLFLPSMFLGTKADAACVTLKTDTALAVSGVVSAEFTCKNSFEGSTQHGSVTISATTEADAVKIMDDVLRAFAASSGMDATWRAPSEFKSQDGTIVVRPSALGFNGIPWISDLREHYGTK